MQASQVSVLTQVTAHIQTKWKIFGFLEAKSAPKSRLYRAQSFGGISGC